MSKYMINKLMRAVEMSDLAVKRYVADPGEFVDEWLAEVDEPHRRADDRSLTQEESAAFRSRDFGELYRLGVHPYLLWHFVEATYIHEVAWPDLNARYRKAITPHGYPDMIV